MGNDSYLQKQGPKHVKVLESLLAPLSILAGAAPASGPVGAFASVGLLLSKHWAQYVTSSAIVEDARTIESKYKVLERRANLFNKEIEETSSTVQQLINKIRAAMKVPTTQVTLGNRRVRGPSLNQMTGGKLSVDKLTRFGVSLDEYTRLLDEVGSAVETMYKNVEGLRNELIVLQKKRDKGHQAFERCASLIRQFNL
jgi:ribosomal protein L13E